MGFPVPEPKKLKMLDGTVSFNRLTFVDGCKRINGACEMAKSRFWNMSGLLKEEGVEYTVTLCDTADKGADDPLFKKQGYTISVENSGAKICFFEKEGLYNGIATFKQLIDIGKQISTISCLEIEDSPSIEIRSISTTFAWYAGYGRIGFDSQLWGFDEWKRFIDICSDYKINQLNMCMYGFWPFDFPEYEETVFRDIDMKVYDPESDGPVNVKYTHPNVRKPFLRELIEYGNSLGIRFFAYIGLNSYNGGYSCRHPEKRMKKPANSKFINDFDSLCLSDPTTVDYLKASIRKVLDQGFNGIDFEESEEAFWYCQCDRCKETFWKNASTPEEALHAANTALLSIMYDEIKRYAPECIVGIRAWRQPPLIRDDALIKSMVESIPKDVVLFWAPGQYVPDSEFEKWAKAFGKDRIMAHDTEAIGFAAGFGRLIRPFKFNGLRCGEESITQYVEEDIRQHRTSAKVGVKGINGYQFEWYGFFMAFFAHAYYGWGGDREPEDFYRYVLKAVFRDEADDILYVMKHMFTIHESQLNVFKQEFPFARNKVELRDVPRIKEAILDHENMMAKLDKIKKYVTNHEEIAHFVQHFEKWQVCQQRNRVIYDMALLSLDYEAAKTDADRREILKELLKKNEEDFRIVGKNYFDVYPVSESGIKSCMIPCHELRRVVENELDPDNKDDEPVYLGVEALGWLWC